MLIVVAPFGTPSSKLITCNSFSVGPDIFKKLERKKDFDFERDQFEKSLINGDVSPLVGIEIGG
jgi:hypothetical protein